MAKKKKTTKPDDYVSYGFNASIAKAVPEIGKLLKTAAADHWDAQRFRDKLEDTAWWKKYSDTAKQMIQMQAQDPAQYAQQVKAAQAHVRQIAGQLGVSLNAAQLSTLATTDLWQGLDDATLQSSIGALYHAPPPGTTAGGTAVTLASQIEQLADSYGVPVTQTWINGMVRGALTNNTGIEAAQKSLQDQAASLYTPIAAQIKAGQTTQQIAQPYIASMAQLLEVPDTSISVTDPTVQKALLGQLPSSTGTSAKPGQPAAAPTNLDDFQNALRKDPRWDSTDNAKQSAFSLVHGLLQNMGFAT